MTDSLASRVRHLMQCGALPNNAKLEIEGRVTEVSMFDVEEALERAENPKLPKGYEVKDGVLFCPEGGDMANTAPDGWFKVKMTILDPNDAQALAAFLQGAR